MEQLHQLYSKVGFKTDFAHNLAAKLCKRIGSNAPSECLIVSKRALSYISNYERNDQKENEILKNIVNSGFIFVERYCSSSQTKLRGYFGKDIRIEVDIFFGFRFENDDPEDIGRIHIFIERIKN